LWMSSVDLEKSAIDATPPGTNFAAAHEAQALPIGLFDSGVGGLTVLRAVRRLLPQEKTLYLGDTARTPYGSKGQSTIVRYSRECAHFLRGRGIKLLIVACNTSSAVALELLRDELPCPVIGTIEPAVRFAIERTRSGRVGVIGTEATIQSGSYQDALRHSAPTLEVSGVACPLFVPLVEQGLFEGPVVDAVIEHHLADLKRNGVDTLILGCTHYPLLREAISRFFDGKVSMIECSEAVAAETKRLLHERDLTRKVDGDNSELQGSEQLFVTDAVSRFDRLARKLIGDSDPQVQRVELLLPE
jgi:glutamate racemase